MSTPYMTQIEAFAFGFPPRGWLLCAGQTLPISQYQALFALLGTRYGGNGITTFKLPDLQGRIAVGTGQGQGLSLYTTGENGGHENTTISSAQMPPGTHTHSINCSAAATDGTNIPSPSVSLASGYKTTDPVTAVEMYSTAAPTVTMGTLAPTGGQGHENRMPYLVLNYCISIAGVFPSRT